MWKDKALYKLGQYGLAALVVGFGTFAIVKGQKQPAPIVFNGLPNQPAVDLGYQSPATGQADVIIHVAGAVAKPGVFRLKAEARVLDAVNEAGGAAPDADLDKIDLAAKLVDGTQVMVPHKGKVDEEATVRDGYRGGRVSDLYSKGQDSSPSKKEPSSTIKLNSASAEELQALPGIGPSTAQKILDYRTGHGKFRSVDELMAVKGIGPKKLERIKKYLQL